jgi:hypothetical protein
MYKENTYRVLISMIQENKGGTERENSKGSRPSQTLTKKIGKCRDCMSK